MAGKMDFLLGHIFACENILNFAFKVGIWQEKCTHSESQQLSFHKEEG